MKKIVILFILLIASSVQAEVRIAPSDDTFVDSEHPGQNFGTNTHMHLKKDASGSPKKVGYLKFGLSNIPSGFNASNLYQAVLRIYTPRVQAGGTIDIGIVPETAWNEATVTYNNQPIMTDYPSYRFNVHRGDTFKQVTADITNIVRGWLRAPTTNYGIRLAVHPGTDLSFITKEHTDITVRPFLELIFIGHSSGNLIPRVVTLENSQVTQNTSIASIETKNTDQDSSITTLETKNTDQDSSISVLETKDVGLENAIGNLNKVVNDSLDTVEMKFARKVDYSYTPLAGTQITVNAIDINGTNLFTTLSNTKLAPTISIGGTSLTVLKMVDIENSTDQQVIAHLPSTILNGSFPLTLTNSVGTSEIDFTFLEGTGFRGAFVKMLNHQAMAGWVHEKINWGRELTDTDNIHHDTTNNSRLTVPAGVSKVIIKASAFWAFRATGYREIHLRKNGSDRFDYAVSDSFIAENGLNGYNTITSATIPVVAGDYFEIFASHGMGTRGSRQGLNINNLSTTWFSMEIVE